MVERRGEEERETRERERLESGRIWRMEVKIHCKSAIGVPWPCYHCDRVTAWYCHYLATD